jgi:hypothetical protein
MPHTHVIVDATAPLAVGDAGLDRVGALPDPDLGQALAVQTGQYRPQRTRAQADGEKLAVAKLAKLRTATAARLLEARKPGDAALAKLDADAKAFPSLRNDQRWRDARSQVLAARRDDVAEVRFAVAQETSDLVRELTHAAQQNPGAPLGDLDFKAFDAVDRVLKIDPDEGLAALSDALAANPSPALAHQLHVYARALGRRPEFDIGTPSSAARGGLLAQLTLDAASLTATPWTVARDIAAQVRDRLDGQLGSLAAMVTGDVDPTQQNAVFTDIDVPAFAPVSRPEDGSTIPASDTPRGVLVAQVVADAGQR